MGRIVEIKADSIIYEQVFFSDYIIKVFKSYPITGCKTLITCKNVVIKFYPATVHQKTAYKVIGEYVVFKHIVVAIHVV